MSHDQKPGRIRLVGGEPKPGPSPSVSGTAPPPLAAAGIALRKPALGRAKMLGSLFVLGCVAGGVAMPLLHIV